MIKKITVVSTLSAIALITSVNANAANPGFYLDGNAGYGKVNETFDRATTEKNTGFAFGGDIGYQFNQYIGLELGANHFADQEATYRGPITFTAKGSDNYSFNAAVKLSLPLDPKFNVFVKGGVARVHHQESVNVASRTLVSESFNATTAFGAVGAEYMINNNVGVTAQALATPKQGTSNDILSGKNAVPAMYAGLVGLSFHFN